MTHDSPTPPAFEYDVFISYSQQDFPWVQDDLLPRLEAAGLKTCIDPRDFRPGAPKVKEMERAVLTSSRTLLVLTPAYLTDQWGEFENLILQSLDPTNKELRLIPLLKEACDLPPRLKMLTQVNFADPQLAKYIWRQLLVALGAQPALEETSAPDTPASWALIHPYPMSPHFSGRDAERRILADWLEHDPNHPLLMVRALGGFGKSALSWHWLLHDVPAQRWPQVVWWSFYEGDASFEGFLASTLAYLRIDPRTLGPRQQVDGLLAALRRPGLLLVLDGFERQLRAFSGLNAAYQGDGGTTPSPTGGGMGWGDQEERQCISPHAEYFLRALTSLPGIQGKVLMSTRLRPSMLEVHGGALVQGGCERELKQLQPADAVALLRALGVRGNRNEIENACERYGFHPLSLRLLAGVVVNHLATPGDISAAQRVNVAGDLVQRQHHVLEHAYSSLTPPRRALLGRIACFRFGIDYPALKAIAEQAKDKNFDADLRDLLGRGLVQRDEHSQRFDLHPIVRHYAYERMAIRTRKSAHRLLIVYFQAVPEVEQPQRLDDLQPVIELYHHTLAAGQYDEAVTLFRDRIHDATYYQFGAYQLYADLLRGLFPDGETQPPRLKDEIAQGWTLNSLANSYSLSGQPRRAVSLVEGYIAISEKRGDKTDLAIGLGNLADNQAKIGAFQAVAANLHRRIELCREIKNEFREAIGHRELGLLLAYAGAWQLAQEELAAALALNEKINNVHGQGLIWAYRALCNLLLTPTQNATLPTLTHDLERGEALAAARRALELADEDARTNYPKERDYVRTHWLLGSALRLHGDLASAEQHLSEALTRCRTINMVDHEANILIDLARLRIEQGEAGEAQHLAEEARSIAERCGYVMQAADAHLELAKLAKARGERAVALAHAQAARRHATCDGPPDWTYKAAYVEAGRLLAELG